MGSNQRDLVIELSSEVLWLTEAQALSLVIGSCHLSNDSFSQSTKMEIEHFQWEMMDLPLTGSGTVRHCIGGIINILYLYKTGKARYVKGPEHISYM